MGEEVFFANKDYDYLKEPEVPPCFVWLYNVFLELYNGCGDNLTWSEIKAFCDMRQVVLTQIELDYIFKMNSWANAQIKKMRDESEE